MAWTMYFNGFAMIKKVWIRLAVNYGFNGLPSLAYNVLVIDL